MADTKMPPEKMPMPMHEEPMRGPSKGGMGGRKGGK